MSRDPATTDLGRPSLWTLPALRQTRALVTGRRGATVAALIGGVYAAVSLLAGNMLQFAPTGAHGLTLRILENPASPLWWNYPAVFVEFPSGVLLLPFLASVTMIVASVGVGLGMAAGLLFAVRLLREWRRGRQDGGPVSALAGFTPAMVAVLTLGACCSTTAAAAAGLGAVAFASGVSVTTVAANAWYLNILQLAVLGLALLAQEGLLSVYAGIVGEGVRAGTTSDRPTVSRTQAPFGLLAVRSLLVGGGLIWALGLLLVVETASGRPTPTASFGTALLEHLGPGSAAVVAGLYPSGVRRIRSGGGLRRRWPSTGSSLRPPG